MSKKNNWDNKSSARERLKVEREKEARRAKMRRQIYAVVGFVVVICAGAGIAVAVSKAGKSNAAPDDVVTYGNPNAKHTLHLYEDPRCPICAAFEQEDGAQIVKGADAGQYKIEYTFGTFLDKNDGGTGSMHALAAMDAALHVSQKAFIEFHTALYSKANHPDESVDKLSDNSYLFGISNQVPELKDNKTFQKAVEDGKYNSWAQKMSDSFNNSGVTGTPTAKVDGKNFAVTGFTNPNNNPPEGIIPLGQFTQGLDKAFGIKG